jgi:hypothetical protein
MRTSALILAICVCLLNRVTARAADFDGTKPFVCSLIHVVVCDRTGEVEKETAEGINLPQFFSIEVGKKMVTAKTSPDEGRQSPIDTVRHENGTLILEGVQLGKPWHAVINEETGKATITSTTESTAFVVFAACTLTQPAGAVK